MKTTYVPPIVFSLSCLAFLAYLAFSAAQLPEPVATHFDLAGQPNGWMTRTQCVAFALAMDLGMPLFIMAVFFVGRFLPNSAINLPGRRRDYWLAPERRASTFAYLFRQSFWLASMMIGLFAALHYLTLQANRQGAALAHLSAPVAIALVGCFVVAILVWLVWVFRHFR